MISALQIRNLKISNFFSVFLFSLFIFPNWAEAQKEANNWLFGFQAGINFNSAPPQPILSSRASGVVGCASISDAAGNLQFYFDGSNTVYNRNHLPMPNGNGFNSRNRTNLIIPWPGQQKYYLFAGNYTGPVSILSSYTGYSGYSVVDMTLNNGLGDITGSRNVFLTDSSNACVAVKHRNNRDYWIIFQKLQAKTFHAFLVSPNGLNTTPVVSKINSLTTNPNASTWGWIIKASPDGRTIAVSSDASPWSSDSLRILNFDPSTGIVSKKYAIYTSNPFISLEFSPDGTKLYGNRDELFQGGYKSFLVQYDLDAGSPLAIQNSMVLIYRFNRQINGAMQVGPDAKIYFNEGVIGASGYNAKYLHAIQRPNLKGLACRFTLNAINVNPQNVPNTHSVGAMLPSFVQNYFYRPKIVMQQTCFGDSARFVLGNPAYVDSVNWNFGDPASGSSNTSKLFNPTHFYPAGGTYQVQTIVHFNYDSDTITRSIFIPASIIKPNFGPDTALCAGSTLKLNAYQQGSTYLWQDSLIADSVFTVTRAGTYWVKVSNGCGERTDTINVSFDIPLSLNLGSDTVLCHGQQLQLIATASPNLEVMWQDSSTNISYTVSKPGTYWAEIKNACGTWRDSITVNYQPQIIKSWLPKDTILCNQNSLVIAGNQPNALSYRWQNGSTSPVLTANKSGIYWLEITTKCNTFRDSIAVTFNQLPVSRFADTTLCSGAYFNLKAPIGLSYIWNTGDTTNQINISKAGFYKVKIETLPGCFFTDSLKVSEIRCFSSAFINNIITPNNDKLNDRFEPKGLESGNWELNIYNRWGKLIFKKENYLDQWPETQIIDGTYYYLLRNQQTGKTYKGWVEIVK